MASSSKKKKIRKKSHREKIREMFFFHSKTVSGLAKSNFFREATAKVRKRAKNAVFLIDVCVSFCQ
jgi:hypothetical protein